MSYTEGEARYRAALQKLVQADPGASEREVARFVAALRPGALARVRSHWGGSTLDELTHRDSSSVLAPTCVPDAAARAAIADIDAAWPHVGATAQSGMERLLDGWGIVWRDEEGLACNLPLLTALCVAHGIEGESGWLSGHVSGMPTDLARAVAPDAARETVAAAKGEERIAWLASLTPGHSLLLARTLAQTVLAEQEQPDDARELAAARIRRVLLDALRGAQDGLDAWCGWLVDVPDEAPTLESACPLLLAGSATSVLRGVLGSTGECAGAVDALVRLLVGAPDSMTADALLRGLALLGAAGLETLVDAARAADALSVMDLMDGLRPASCGPAGAVLVDRPAAGSIPWTLLVEAAALPSLEEDLHALLAQDEAWDTFDAPGEGELPAFWADVLVVVGRWDDAWHSRLAERCPEAQLPPVGTVPGDLASRYRSPLAGAEQRLDPDRSPMSAYSHGLHDGVSEAYGDVWSPGDPFSARRRT